MKKRLSALACVAAIAALAASCREPTEVEVEVRTNVPYQPTLVTAFTVGSVGETENAFSTTETSNQFGADGFVGSLVVVPGSSKDAPLSVKVVMGVHADTRACSIASPKGCIIARRTLHYLPHAKLSLPIALYAVCEGVACDPSSTCNAFGLCVPAAVDESSCDTPEGCSPPDDRPPPPGAPLPPAPPPDASLDTLEDAPAQVDGDTDASKDASKDALSDTAGSRPTCGGVNVVSCNGNLCTVTEKCCGPGAAPQFATCMPSCNPAIDFTYCCSNADCVAPKPACSRVSADPNAGICQ